MDKRKRELRRRWGRETRGASLIESIRMLDLIGRKVRNDQEKEADMICGFFMILNHVLCFWNRGELSLSYLFNICKMETNCFGRPGYTTINYNLDWSREREREEWASLGPYCSYFLISNSIFTNGSNVLVTMFPSVVPHSGHSDF